MAMIRRVPCLENEYQPVRPSTMLTQCLTYHFVYAVWGHIVCVVVLMCSYAGIWSPLCGPGASRPSSAMSSLHSPSSQPSSAIGSPLSRPSSALDQLGLSDTSIGSVLGRVDETFYCDDALDMMSDGRVWDLDDTSNPTSPVHAGSRPSTAVRTRESKLDGLGVSRYPSKRCC